MASRKPPSAPEWQVILERIESQNRMTIEAVEVNRAVLEDRMQALESNLGGRFGTLETATKELAGRIDGLEDSMRTLGDSIARTVEAHLASPAVSKKLAENVGVFVVAEVGAALANVKGDETLRSIGMRLAELRFRNGG